MRSASNKKGQRESVAAYRIVGEVELGQHHERVDVVGDRAKHELA
jgi:hypothetical protein